MRGAASLQLVACKRGDEPAQVRSAARAADHNIGLHADLVERRLGLQPDDGLVQQHLVEHAAERIAAPLGRGRLLYGFGDGGAQGSGVVGILCQDGAADRRFAGGRFGDARVVRLHDRFAVGFLLRRALHHEHMQVEPEKTACHRQRGAPLTGARLGGEAGQTLLLGVVGLRDGGVELVGAGRVVALEFVVDLGGRAQRLLEELGMHQRRGAVHAVEVAHRIGNRDEPIGGVELLAGKFGGEHGRQIVDGHRLERRGVEHRGVIGRHVGAHVVVVRRQLFLGQIGLVLGARSLGHLHLLSLWRRRQ